MASSTVAQRPRYFWVALPSGKRMCIDAASEADVQVRADEAQLGAVKVLGRLPYAAEPRLPIGTVGWGQENASPSFCYAPNQCLGRSCCPQRYSCTE